LVSHRLQPEGGKRNPGPVTFITPERDIDVNGQGKGRAYTGLRPGSVSKGWGGNAPRENREKNLFSVLSIVCQAPLVVNNY